MSEGVSPLVGTLRRARAVAVARVVAGGFEVLSRVGGATPLARPERYGAELAGRDLPYGPHPRQTVDIYRPVESSGPAPVMVYFHGGGFRAMSKDTHWLMALRFARAGFVVVNVDYRLAPESPFPAAAQDACAAIRLAVDLAGRYGGDPSRLLIAGESAGANLTAVATIACCFERPEPWARDVYKLGLVPRASLPACGILQVSDTERFTRAKPLPLISRDALRDPEAAYLKRSLSGEVELADPLLVMERAARADRPLPPHFLPCGTKDPLLDDTRRMAAAVTRLGGESILRVYPGEIHAFHALVWRPAARRCWEEMTQFALDRSAAP